MHANADRHSPTATVPMAAVDAEGTVTLWSPAARHLLGHAPGEVIGRPAAGLLAAPLPGPALRALTRSAPWSGVLTARHRDGSAVRVTVRAHPCPEGDGRVQWVLLGAAPEEASAGGPHAGPDAVLADAARKDAALKEWAYLQSPVATAVYDRDLRLTGANGEMLRLSGRPEEAMLGLRLTEIFPGSPFDEFGRLMAEVLRTGETLRTDTFFRAPGQSRERAWATFFTPLKDDGGRVQGVSIAAIDRTEPHRARERLAMVNDAGARIGTTLDVGRTAEELADVTAGGFADLVTVDLLDAVLHSGDPAGTAPGGGQPDGVVLRRTAARPGRDGLPAGPQGAFSYAPHSPPAEALASGRASLHRADAAAIGAWADGTGGTVPPDAPPLSDASAFTEAPPLSGAQALTDAPALSGVPAPSDTPALTNTPAHAAMHSVLVVPLRARGTTLGVALFVRHPGTEPFDADDLLLAEEIAARAGVCVDNARRYAAERSVALTLQRSLLPGRLPEQAAVEVTSRYLPAGAQAGVGGDWFDVIPLSGARVALVVGDVVGHGLQASAVMGRLRAAVRTLADLDLPPDELLTHLDDLVVQLAQDEAAEGVPGAVRETGATCLYVVYDPVSRSCVLARAGHPAPVLVTPGGTARFLDIPGGPPLGLGGLPFESAELQLPEGSLLALYTDGLVEGHDHDIGAGLDRLRAALSGPAAPLEQTCDAVLDALLPSRPERPTDDIALLLARTRALDASQVRSWDLPAERSTVADARKFASEQLAAWGLEELGFTTELVVSELVTNAVRHAYAPIRLRLIRERSSLICEVSDASSTSPRMRRARVTDEGGRGLLLVAQLTERWGTRFTSDGKTIWAEQPLAAAG
ncbi:SpoIIE family protein phosphatase [Streptomyces roseoverticillatus]|uniref:SpoIIE family protein phosphatase n=1 Tax=Streptomyces roseoverticillatus TaxID=66429 RepID=UPI001F2E1AA7|nr:SpoIIE family protein phosphatase [Streptomyces roseoverticillatus]MCF3101864.1 SpoIIE family protein phosphatase [Streptomyces roseoverticillatus]